MVPGRDRFGYFETSPTKGVVFVSLRKALERLPGDRATESLVREVIQLLRVRVGESLSVAEVAKRLGHPEPTIAVVLLGLADAYVLRRDGLCYSYVRDPVVELDVDRFMARVESHSAFVQTNVAKFRDRYGYR
jgi:hypothetical protein